MCVSYGKPREIPRCGCQRNWHGMTLEVGFWRRYCILNTYANLSGSLLGGDALIYSSTKIIQSIGDFHSLCSVGGRNFNTTRVFWSNSNRNRYFT